jgi:hypothetical protein
MAKILGGKTLEPGANRYELPADNYPVIGPPVDGMTYSPLHWDLSGIQYRSPLDRRPPATVCAAD